MLSIVIPFTRVNSKYSTTTSKRPRHSLADSSLADEVLCKWAVAMMMVFILVAGCVRPSTHHIKTINLSVILFRSLGTSQDYFPPSIREFFHSIETETNTYIPVVTIERADLPPRMKRQVRLEIPKTFRDRIREFWGANGPRYHDQKLDQYFSEARLGHILSIPEDKAQSLQNQINSIQVRPRSHELIICADSAEVARNTDRTRKASFCHSVEEACSTIAAVASTSADDQILSFVVIYLFPDGVWPSKQRPHYFVPALVGQSMHVVRTSLHEAGLRLGITERRETNASVAGTVLEQSPPADLEVDSGTAVNVVVAVLPAERHVVPELFGLSLDAASTLLDRAGLRLGSVEHRKSNEFNAGTVIEQSVPSGREISAGTIVNVAVVGVKAPPSPPHPPDKVHRPALNHTFTEAVGWIKTKAKTESEVKRWLSDFRDDGVLRFGYGQLPAYPDSTYLVLLTNRLVADVVLLDGTIWKSQKTTTECESIDALETYEIYWFHRP